MRPANATFAALQVQLHKQRGDMDLIESPWVAARDEVPLEQYTWKVTDEANTPSDVLRYRKVTSPNCMISSTAAHVWEPLTAEPALGLSW